METTQSLDRGNFPFTNRLRRGQQSIVAALGRARLFSHLGKVGGVLPNAATPQFQPRAADLAGVRLGVEAAVARVVVLCLALRAHREHFHRSVRPVVGQGFDDAETRTAMGAIREWITVAAIFWVENFAEAIRAGGNVGQHERRFYAASFAGADFKILEAGR